MGKTIQIDKRSGLHEALHLGGSAVAAAQSLLVLLKCAMEWLDSPTLHLPQLIDSGRNQVLVMTDHQHSTLKGCQALQSKWDASPLETDTP